jgi:hypothetical protein
VHMHRMGHAPTQIGARTIESRETPRERNSPVDAVLWFGDESGGLTQFDVELANAR